MPLLSLAAKIKSSKMLYGHSIQLKGREKAGIGLCLVSKIWLWMTYYDTLNISVQLYTVVVLLSVPFPFFQQRHWKKTHKAAENLYSFPHFLRIQRERHDINFQRRVKKLPGFCESSQVTQSKLGRLFYPKPLVRVKMWSFHTNCCGNSHIPQSG